MQPELDNCGKRARDPCRVVAVAQEVVHKSQGAALTITVSLDVDADDEDKPLFCVDLCAQSGTCQTANCWALQKRVTCPPGRSNSAVSGTVFFVSSNDTLLCAEILDLLNRRAMYGGFVETS